jgi:hypothetical protein
MTSYENAQLWYLEICTNVLKRMVKNLERTLQRKEFQWCNKKLLNVSTLRIGGKEKGTDKIKLKKVIRYNPRENRRF